MESRAPSHRKTWILIADASRARIFAHDAGDDDLTLVREFEDHEGLTGIDAGRGERPGRPNASASGQAGRRPARNPRDEERDQFARDLVYHLEAGFGHQQFGHLVMVASPPFLGTLMVLLPDRLQRALKTRVDKDYTLAAVAEVRALVIPLLRRRAATVG